MVAGLLILFVYVFLCWRVFFKLKLVKKGQPLFQFDRRPYQHKVDAAKAQWDSAKYAVVQAEAARSGLKAALSAATYTAAEARSNQATTKDALQVATASVGEARAAANLAKDKFVMDESLRKQQLGAISQLNYDKDQQNLKEAEAALKVALDTETKARAAVETVFESVQIAVANQETTRIACEEQAPAAIEVARANAKKAEAEWAQAVYYLDNTTMVAPEDGQIINLQVQPGMVAGIFRIGAIASFIVDADRYVLATYNQENLKYVKSGQPAEVAFDLYPGQIFKGKVDAIWWGSGQGQFLPSGDIPVFTPPPPGTPQGRFAVKILLDAEDQSKFPIGAQGSAAIYTSGGGFAALRRIAIRANSWLNWLYPLA
jgi:multidrug resistance efflux pump